MKTIIFISLIVVAYNQIAVSCPQGSFWTGQTCLPCANPFCSCSAYNTCDAVTSCQSGEVMNSQYQCVSCPYGCAACTLIGTTGFTCTSCEYEFQLIQGACIDVNPPSYYPSQSRWQIQQNLYIDIELNTTECLSLNPKTGLCQSCPSNAFFNEYSECEYCVSNCATCNSRGTCTTCDNGFYWSPVGSGTSAQYGAGSGSCVQCNTALGVQTCDSQGQPLTCLPGYYFQTGSPSQCNACSQYCTTCSSPTQCTACMSGSYLKNGACTLCPGNTANTGNLFTGACVDCQSTYSSNQCGTCQTGYINVGGTCSLCSTITNCQTCNVLTGNQLSCSVCDPGFYLTASSTSSQLTCSSCYSFNSTYQYCNKGPKGTDATVTVTQCTTSIYEALTSQNLFLVNGLCIPNTNACNTMIDVTGTCSKCVTGYILLSGVCKQCPSYCTTCSTSGTNVTCTSCMAGFYSTNYNQQCSPCGPGCTSCANETSCTTCSSGYYNNNGICNACPISNCQSCSTNTTTCQTCMPNFFSYQSSSTAVTNCLLCPPGCSDCQASQGKTCTTCITGWFKKGDGCYQGSINCAQFNADGTCATCAYGFRVSNGICLPCVQTVNGYVCNANAAC